MFHTNKEREALEADHEYETLDEYDQADIGVKVPPPKSESIQLHMLPSAASGDYEFTQCPAYVAVATTSIHGNTDKPE